MKHLIKKHRSQCMLYSFAMALDCEPDEIVNITRRTGQEVLWPHLAPPKCYRGLHISELIYVCYLKGFTCYEFPKILLLGHDMSDAVKITPPYNIYDILLKHTGVLLGDYHCCAWDGIRILDPEGPVLTIDHMEWGIFYAISKLKGQVDEQHL